MSLTGRLPVRWAAAVAAGRDAAQAPPPAAEVRLTLGLAAALLAVAVGLYLAGGTQAGFAALNGVGPRLPPAAWAGLTGLGNTAVALMLVLPFWRRQLHLAPVVLIAAVLGTVFTHALKIGLGVPRPAGVLPVEAFHSVGALSTTGSFPSGHSQTALTLAAVAIAATERRALWLAAAALGVCIALSRVVVGMHWPVDVAVGAAGGLICTALARRVVFLRPQLVSAAAALLVLALCTLAAILVLAGLEPGGTLAGPVLRALAALAIGGALWSWLGPERRST